MTITKEKLNKLLNHIPSITLIIVGFALWYGGAILSFMGVMGDSEVTYLTRPGGQIIHIAGIIMAIGFVSGALKLVRLIVKFHKYMNRKK